MLEHFVLHHKDLEKGKYVKIVGAGRIKNSQRRSSLRRLNDVVSKNTRSQSMISRFHDVIYLITKNSKEYKN